MRHQAGAPLSKCRTISTVGTKVYRYTTVMYGFLFPPESFFASDLGMPKWASQAQLPPVSPKRRRNPPFLLFSDLVWPPNERLQQPLFLITFPRRLSKGIQGERGDREKRTTPKEKVYRHSDLGRTDTRRTVHLLPPPRSDGPDMLGRKETRACIHKLCFVCLASPEPPRKRSLHS